VRLLSHQRNAETFAEFSSLLLVTKEVQNFVILLIELNIKLTGERQRENAVRDVTYFRMRAQYSGPEATNNTLYE